MYERCSCRHCGKDYLTSRGFSLLFTCRGCAAEGKTEPSRRRIAEAEHYAETAPRCSQRLADDHTGQPKRRRRRAGRSGRERREAQVSAQHECLATLSTVPAVKVAA